MSTFHGLEMAKQALFAQRSALSTTGHNISNANTEGYTRQRVNFEALDGYPASARNRPEIPGQMGTGVQVGTIERVRDDFLDRQYRAENSKAGYWETKSNTLARMENLMNEPSETGLSHTMDQFWQSLQDLAVNPESDGARSVVAQRGMAVAETFNYLADSLTSIRSELEEQIDDSVLDANLLMKEIHTVNEQIKQLEPHGYLPNDLYDERDRLIDDLSNMINIKVVQEESADSSPDIAQGPVTIEVVNRQGTSLEPRVILVNGVSGEEGINELVVEPSYNGITVGSEEESYNIPLESNGAIAGLIDAYGHDGNEDVVNYKMMLDRLDQLAHGIAEEFNSVHREGYGLESNEDEGDGLDFFTFKEGLGPASGITVSEEDILNNPGNIAASGALGQAGNGENAFKLADVFNDKTLEGNPLGENMSVNSFYQSLIGELGVAAQEANRMTNNTEILRSQVENQRLSMSSVSLDEEMSNMIKFQHAYNASARSMTAMDELLDRVINNMGLVGR